MLALLLASWIVSAQSYLFKHLEVSDGLSNNSVNTIYKDRDGFMWFGTTTGLNRYDGAKFITYKHDPENEYSLCHNYVRVLYEDSKGRLFVGTYNGIQLYDPETDSFSVGVFTPT